MNSQIIKSYEEEIELKYQLYNSLFLSLQLEAVEKAGNLIPLLYQSCVEGLEKGKDPIAILQTFFASHKAELSAKERDDFLFKVIQYIERQIVLIDALEDAAYNKIHRITGENSYSSISDRVKKENLMDKMAQTVKEFGVRVVLTAHPTQFYPSQVLAIINDLMVAIKRSEVGDVRDMLKQLGKTPFYQKIKPTPLDEANRLTFYLRDTFYPAIGQLLDKTAEDYSESLEQNNQFISLGFWPGGDRDGNPFVNVETTMQVAAKLRNTISNCYFQEVKELKRRITFAGVHAKVVELESLLKAELSNASGSDNIDLADFLARIDKVEQLIRKKHQGFFIEKVQSLKRKVQLFGFYMASIDIRQDSRVIGTALKEVVKAYPDILPANLFEMDEKEQIPLLVNARGAVDANIFEDEVVKDTVASFGVIKDIQRMNGERGAHRYIISNCRGPLDVARVLAMFRICGWGYDDLKVDIVPLFETIDDLKMAGEAMYTLYANPTYRKHLKNRDNRQTVMLGFSDGTKDGGYLMANWAIFRAKENITLKSRENDVEVVFFDGRGGPPARGGGNAHRFYAAMGKNIENRQIQMTVQGQTISSHYGITEAAAHNMGYLLTAGLSNNIYSKPQNQLQAEQRDFISEMAESSYKKYLSLKEHPLFMPYLEEVSTLKYYGKANIGSRPSKRGGSDKINFGDLRAIPFVGAWSQLKQNVPGFYGVGTALKEQEEKGNLQACIDLYKESIFFKTLLSNSMQSMSKTNFQITQYLEKNERFGEFWQMLHDEYRLTKEMLLKVSGLSNLLDDNPRSFMSIRLRERVVLPLLLIQQYALMKIQEAKNGNKDIAVELYEKMVIRAMFGNINASRNSA
ncbi:Phosphoenolpyruvate carboxylase, type 1 [Saccharicrinis carchari]|uniref:Phosphoenolpyruvate carboxylase n=1 Tax=Saccharicrinis carchari TaxID=1168039 RepID=A0A521D6M7_SACCC|nr:phosphoenolpyruvate carboxylase [Saccharicrinis carchari]SMO66721.1 Phosphoenolpyruvate carboxylase, type 1 [Saccharicrinis carchari]